MSEKKYKPVSVAAAKQIAEKFDKAIVIINCWDTTHGVLHTTTYGVSKEQKHQAAVGGDISAKALGAEMPRKNAYEDFRKEEIAKAVQHERENALEVAKSCVLNRKMGQPDPLVLPEPIYKKLLEVGIDQLEAHIES